MATCTVQRLYTQILASVTAKSGHFPRVLVGFMAYAAVEQDDCYGTDPFECLKISYDNLKSHGLD